MEKGEKTVSVFLDASVLVAATLSSTGGSFRVITESGLRGFLLITSRYAYKEAERALESKYPQHLGEFYHLATFFMLRPEPPEKFIDRVSKFIDFKDAPVLAAALATKSDILLTLDREHFLENKQLEEKFPALSIMTPGDFIQAHFLSK